MQNIDGFTFCKYHASVITNISNISLKANVSAILEFIVHVSNKKKYLRNNLIPCNDLQFKTNF